MYPILRFAKDVWRARRAPPLAVDGIHVSHHRIMPWDLDPWIELNNGRTLTLYDLGRIPLAIRTGLADTIKREGWGLTVAGSVIRYRKRLTNFQKVEMRSRLMGWDARFLYIEQSMWTEDGDCANHGLLRTAVLANRRMLPVPELLKVMGLEGVERPLPDWAARMYAAENDRPWPPEIA